MNSIQNLWMLPRLVVKVIATFCIFGSSAKLNQSTQILLSFSLVDLLENSGIILLENDGRNINNKLTSPSQTGIKVCHSWNAYV